MEAEKARDLESLVHIQHRVNQEVQNLEHAHDTNVAQITQLAWTRCQQVDASFQLRAEIAMREYEEPPSNAVAVRGAGDVVPFGRSNDTLPSIDDRVDELDGDGNDTTMRTIEPPPGDNSETSLVPIRERQLDPKSKR
ncbi:hypothetical protein MMC16_007684 [Acarospora aff. strigata]|nr:hypothetical protein [Acarospora aff. strigata]